MKHWIYRFLSVVKNCSGYAIQLVFELFLFKDGFHDWKVRDKQKGFKAEKRERIFAQD